MFAYVSQRLKEMAEIRSPFPLSRLFAQVHSSELDDGYDWGRLGGVSVTEQGALEDFLATAELAGTEFTAERLNVQIVTETQNEALPSVAQQRYAAFFSCYLDCSCFSFSRSNTSPASVAPFASPPLTSPGLPLVP
jgi:hypothetical protein